MFRGMPLATALAYCMLVLLAGPRQTSGQVRGVVKRAAVNVEAC
jgi:hypothetical protein